MKNMYVHCAIGMCYIQFACTLHMYTRFESFLHACTLLEHCTYIHAYEAHIFYCVHIVITVIFKEMTR